MTPRQLDILRLVAEGEKGQLIARHLGLSEQTIKNTLQAAYGSLGASNAPHAIAILDDRMPGWRKSRAESTRSAG